MDIEFILNDALNKALITDRIKGVPSSNKIADFVSKYVESEQLILPVVVSSEFYCSNDRVKKQRCKEQCGWCEGNE